jgi:hypothetical protein
MGLEYEEIGNAVLGCFCVWLAARVSAYACVCLFVGGLVRSRGGRFTLPAGGQLRGTIRHLWGPGRPSAATPVAVILT